MRVPRTWRGSWCRRRRASRAPGATSRRPLGKPAVPGPWTGGAGWPRVVSHPRLPQIRTCPTRASGSSDHGIATPKRAPARRRFRRRSANCRTCVETAVGSVSSPSVRPTVHDPIRRFPPPGPRGAGSPTSTVLSADSDFSTPVPPHFVSFAWRYHAAALFAPAGVGRSPGRDCCLSRPSVPHLRWRRRDLPGSWATPACMPRSPTPAEPHAPDHLGAAMVPSALVTASASAMFTDFVAQSRSLQGSLCTLRSRGHPRSTQHSVPAGRSTLAGQDSHLLGRIEGFCHVTTCLPPSPSFAWRKTSPSPRMEQKPNSF